ncbi:MULTISPECIES: MOSC domain-containing protein [unclassified Pseudofrankia]|uniref:MOSC domain-containing protein n=1 Tax=unclassified Pseudofrankia TaxID=2994372 RepID=UPI0008DAB439|nr:MULTISPECIES: MOSC domain-containing protein [unclassified Pseudofrankia]MDT3439503.1 MOSC domain-containing protein [Pseudofrankia sp. BMG5.37]OHV48692.1 molybdenum cofactor biosysynthesis protein [Pseudofrankia sp. BMG5.36]
MGSLLAVNLAVVRNDAWTGRKGRSGIDKRPVSGPVRVGRVGLTGDTICDLTFHGGVDRAAYVYAQEDFSWWESALDRGIPPGSFGENLTSLGIDVTGALIGEMWAIGSAVLQVTAPRIPCRVFAGFWDVPDLIQRFIQRGTPGAYLRVLGEGDVSAGDPIRILRRPDHGITVGQVFQALTTDPDQLPALAGVTRLLAEDVRKKVERRLAPPAPVGGELHDLV